MLCGSASLSRFLYLVFFALSMEERSIVSYVGYHEGDHCGYCKGDEPLRASVGIWSFSLGVSHYNGLLDRGMRRSGKYIYKPIIEKTCCPQYTIRLDVNKFYLSRSQKKVLRQINEFLMNNKRPKLVVEEAYFKNDKISKLDTNVKSTPKFPRKTTSNVNHGKLVAEEKHEKRPSSIESFNVDKERRSRKKKFLRREKAFEKMRKKGIDIEEAIKKRAEAEASRRKSIESFISVYDANIAAHKLEMRLVPLGSSAFEATEEESYNLYKKYQETIHNDEDCSKEGFKNFLGITPLEPQSPIYGTFHQHYRIDGKLIAVGVLDILPRCVSATYFFYDPDYKFLSMGTYAALREIAYTRELSSDFPELHYYYMGYYIESCPKMRYKSRFRPSDLLCNRSFTWVPFEDCKEELRRCDRVLAFAKDVPPPTPIPVGSVLCLYERKIMTYSHLLRRSNFIETEDYMESYAALLGTLAQEIILYRSS